MQLVVTETDSNYSKPTAGDENSDIIESVKISFQVSQLFNDSKNNAYNCWIVVTYTDFQNAITPDQQATLVQNKLVDEINNGQIDINWGGYKYIMSGTDISSVDVKFKTFDTNTDNKITIDQDVLNIPYSQFQTDTANGIDGLITDVKSHLITEFTPAAEG